MICRGCRLQVCQKSRHKRSWQNQWSRPCNVCLPQSDLQRSFQYCWWSPKVADGASWWLTASTPSHWWHCSFHILHPITLFPAVDAEMCDFLFSCTPHLQWVLVHILDKTMFLIWFSCNTTSISCALYIFWQLTETDSSVYSRCGARTPADWVRWRVRGGKWHLGGPQRLTYIGRDRHQQRQAGGHLLFSIS